MLAITGASGLLGANMMHSAAELGLEAIGICHRHVIQIPGLEVTSLDLTDGPATRKFFLDVRPSVIVHCAAATNVDWCESHSDSAEAINVRASANLADIASTLNARLVYISTDAVFDGETGSYSEEDKPVPLNIYALTKLNGELETLTRNPSALIARVNIFGWNAQDKYSLAEWALKRLESGGRVPGFTDVFFTPILVNDLVRILFVMLEKELSGIYHVAGSEKLSKFEFASRLASAFGFDSTRIERCLVSQGSLKAARPLDISLNVAKVSGDLGMPMPKVDSGLREFRRLRECLYPQKLKSYLISGECA
jgi:dTDP-4-dehydrorhamnose reductase